MILQALYDYYRRKPELPRPGFEDKEIAFVVVLDETGHFVQLEDTREGEGKKKLAKRFLVPQAVKRSSGIAANRLWDNAGYVFGIDHKGKPDRAAAQHEAFMQAIRDLQAEGDAGVAAVLRFLDDEDEKAKARASPHWQEAIEGGANLSFKLIGHTELVCQSETVRAKLAEAEARSSGDTAMCLVSGRQDVIERLHPAIAGVWGGQPTANIVSFNLDAFNSYGKTQGGNAPVGKQAAFAYTTALKHLLRKDSPQRMQVGDASTVFWAEHAEHPMEDLLADLFNEPPKDDPDRGTRALQILYQSPQSGVAAFDNDRTRFYVLGLAPNVARIAVRFWHVATVDELAGHIRQHFTDLTIARGSNDPTHLSLFRLLVATAVLGKADNIPPNLAGEFMQSILAGTPYPRTLLQAAIRRVRAERDVTNARASLIKACLNRQTRYNDPQTKEELTVSLDETNMNSGYRLGRLFAVLEKIQEEANPGINATIRDRYYGAASSTPVAVFQTLMRLKNHHLAKLDNRGRAVNLEKLIGEIMDGLVDFPPLLSLADQGRFTIGYYHQRHALFAKAEHA